MSAASNRGELEDHKTTKAPRKHPFERPEHGVPFENEVEYVESPKMSDLRLAPDPLVELRNFEMEKVTNGKTTERKINKHILATLTLASNTPPNKLGPTN